MIQSRRERASSMGQGNLVIRLLEMLSDRMGDLATNSELIRQTRITLHKPWRGRGC